MRLAFRVDASPHIGTGHLMRCLTLADALKSRSALTHFLCRYLPDHLAGLLEQKGHPLRRLPGDRCTDAIDDLAHSQWLGTSQAQDANDTLQALAGEYWDWLVVDHYALAARWESVMRQMAKRIMVIDDIADRPHDCDILLDQNLYADMETRYTGKVPSHCQCLLGLRYALLRDEFRRLREQVKPRTGPVKRVLVFFGGMDADNFTGKTIQALANLGHEGLQVDMVTGAQHPARESIEAACGRYGYRCHVQTANMAKLMAWADLAIGAGGSTTWERCCMGLPTLTICVAENQRQLIADSSLEGLLYAPAIQANAVKTLELHISALIENPRLRASISRAGMGAVDGRGALRMIRKLGCSDIVMRLASPTDSQSLFDWRNYPAIRAVSRVSDPITWETHQHWLSSVLSDRNRPLLIGSRFDKPVGVVRFDIEADKAEVSVYLVPDMNEPGLGTDLLASAEQWLTKNRSDVCIIRAEVLGDNGPSHGLFRSSGYQTESTSYIKRLY